MMRKALDNMFKGTTRIHQHRCPNQKRAMDFEIKMGNPARLCRHTNMLQYSARLKDSENIPCRENTNGECQAVYVRR